MRAVATKGPRQMRATEVPDAHRPSARLDPAGGSPTTRQTRRADERLERGRLTRELLVAAEGTHDHVEKERLRAEVVLLNRGVARAVAHRYRGRGIAVEDLEQTAYVGLLRAVRSFDAAIRPDLLTYAVPTIRGEIQRYFRDVGWAVRPPRRIQELQRRLGDATEDLLQALGRTPSLVELARHLGCSAEEVDRALAAFGAFAPLSLDRMSGATDANVTIGEEIAVTDEAETGRVEAVHVLARAVAQLPRRDRQILGLQYYEARTQAEIGRQIGVSQMQVSRLQTRILRDLRRALGVRPANALRPDAGDPPQTLAPGCPLS